MKYLLSLTFVVLSFSSFARGVKLFNTNFLPSNAEIEITLNKVQLSPGLNDNNTFYFGDDDFEMFLTLDGIRQINFPLAANDSDRPKDVELSHSFTVNVEDINSSINKRLGSDSMTETQKSSLKISRIGQLCMLDDSLITPAFLSTSYYGCLDIAYSVQEMISSGLDKKEFFVQKNTVYPASSDPSKAKMFKSWYTIRLL